LDEYLKNHVELRIDAMKKVLKTIADKNEVKDEDHLAQIKALDLLEHKNELKYSGDIKSELQSYEILKNEKYGRLTQLKQALDQMKAKKNIKNPAINQI